MGGAMAQGGGEREEPRGVWARVVGGVGWGWGLASTGKSMPRLRRPPLRGGREKGGSGGLLALRAASPATVVRPKGGGGAGGSRGGDCAGEVGSIDLLRRAVARGGSGRGREGRAVSTGCGQCQFGGVWGAGCYRLGMKHIRTSRGGGIVIGVVLAGGLALLSLRGCSPGRELVEVFDLGPPGGPRGGSEGYVWVERGGRPPEGKVWAPVDPETLSDEQKKRIR